MPKPKDPDRRHRGILLGLGGAGGLAFGVGLLLAPQRAWANLLLGNFFFVSLALYGPVFVALTYLFSGGWAVAFRRVPEAMGAYLPIGGGIKNLAAHNGQTHHSPPGPCAAAAAIARSTSASDGRAVGTSAAKDSGRPSMR